MCEDLPQEEKDGVLVVRDHQRAAAGLWQKKKKVYEKRASNDKLVYAQVEEEYKEAKKIESRDK